MAELYRVKAAEQPARLAFALPNRQRLQQWLHLAVETYLITNHFALPLLLRHPGGLVVEMTDGTADYNAKNYRVSRFYDLTKASVLRTAWSLAHELGPHDAKVVALTPGWQRSEMMLATFGVSEKNWRDATRLPR